jgi:L-gulonolactone oxidase
MPTLTTWGRTHVATPREVARPTREEEVAELVARTAERGGRVRAFGALHSWSDCALDDDLVMSLDAHSGLLEHDGQQAWVRAGTRLYDLNRLLDDEGLALSILGSVDHQSLAGAVSTGTHGSSLVHGNLASSVTALRLVTASGEVMQVDRGDARLDGLRVSLGAMGVLTALRVAVVPAFRLAEVAEPRPVDEVVAQLPSIAASAPYVKVWWLPHTGMAIVFRAEPTTEASTFSALGRWADEKVVNQLGFRGVLGVGKRLPSLVPALNRLVGAAYFRPRRSVGRSHEVFHLAMPPVHREMEYAVPMASASEAMEALLRRVRDEGLPVNFIAEARFVKGDTGWISPAHGGDVLQLGAYVGHGPHAQRYFDGFEHDMLQLGGRPHWGKEFAASGATVRSRYPRIDDWLALVDALDPRGVFRSPFVQRLRE